jgi:hypothetical protein
MERIITKNIVYYSVFSLFMISLLSCTKDVPLSPREYIDTSVEALVYPEVGGPNEPNQVYIDLSEKEQTTPQRDSWDLGFYCGEQFRVAINPSIYMAVKKLDVSDITSITSDDVSDYFEIVATATFDPENVEFVDDFDGDINNTAIDEIQIDPALNSVYLLNMGYTVSTNPPLIGTVELAYEQRGWLKIRILREEDHYILQYAHLDDTDYNQVNIYKDEDYNFVNFSFNTNEIVPVEPPKTEWDICFTVFTNEIEGYGTYVYSDFVLNNYLQGVASYQVTTSDTVNYDDFSFDDLDESLFDYSQRSIGNNWRSSGGPDSSPSVYTDRFFVVKDANGIFYKLKFLALTNAEGERGYPLIQYETL